MKISSLPVAAVLAASLASTAAFAATQIKTGEVKSTDLTKHEFVLSSGETFEAGSKIKLDKLKVGDKVSVSYHTKNGKMIAANIKPSK